MTLTFTEKRALSDSDEFGRTDQATAISEIDFPAFKPRSPWWGGDLQTLRNFVTRATVDLSEFEAERLFFDANDGSGDRLQGALNHPRVDRARPLLVLVHGLTGCEDSVYLQATARHFLKLGWRTLRTNMRGAGPSRASCQYHYHAGRSEDLRAVVAGLPAQWTQNGIALMGYSLGGNQMLKCLGEGGEVVKSVRAAISVSAPVDLMAASRTFLRPRNAVYHRWLLARMKQDALAEGARVTNEEQKSITHARTVYEFDDRFIAPRHGYAGAVDYYERCSAIRFLARIRIPTLVLHARDDPWIPSRALDTFDWRTVPHVRAILPRRGGHVGFHDQSTRVAWHDRCAQVLLQAIAPTP